MIKPFQTCELNFTQPGSPGVLPSSEVLLSANPFQCDPGSPSLLVPLPWLLQAMYPKSPESSLSDSRESVPSVYISGAQPSPACSNYVSSGYDYTSWAPPLP